MIATTIWQISEILLSSIEVIGKLGAAGSSSRWWLNHALLTWVLLSAIWGALTIILDVVVIMTQGNKGTISYQTQQASLDNPVIPAAVGFLVFGLAWHFWFIHDWSLLDPRHPLWRWVVGGILGSIFVYFFWLQRP